VSLGLSLISAWSLTVVMPYCGVPFSTTAPATSWNPNGNFPITLTHLMLFRLRARGCDRNDFHNRPRGCEDRESSRSFNATATTCRISPFTNLRSWTSLSTFTQKGTHFVDRIPKGYSQLLAYDKSLKDRGRVQTLLIAFWKKEELMAKERAEPT